MHLQLCNWTAQFVLHVICRCLAQRACAVLPHTDIYNIYGPTEATIWVSSWHCNGGDFEGVATSPIGPPLANTQLYVLDEQLRPVPVGELLCVPVCQAATDGDLGFRCEGDTEKASGSNCDK